MIKYKEPTTAGFESILDTSCLMSAMIYICRLASENPVSYEEETLWKIEHVKGRELKEGDNTICSGTVPVWDKLL